MKRKKIVCKNCRKPFFEASKNNVCFKCRKRTVYWKATDVLNGCGI